MTERRRYQSDLSDARWQLVEPVLTAWRAERRGRGLDIGRLSNHDLRSLLDADDVCAVLLAGKPVPTDPMPVSHKKVPANGRQ